MRHVLLSAVLLATSGCLVEPWQRDYDCEEGEVGLGSTNAVGASVFEGCVVAPESCAELIAGEPPGDEASACGDAVCPGSEGFSMTALEQEPGEPMILFVCE